MAAEAGWSYWSLVPRFKPGGFKDAVARSAPEIDAPARAVGTRTGTAMSGALGKAFKVGSKAAAAGAVGVVGTALVKGFGRLKAIDEARAKLSGLGHSAAEVQTIMDNALASVKGTAFGLGDAATVAASAVAANVKPGKDLTRTLKLVADAATIGGSSLSEMGLIFNKVAATGKIQGEVIAQLGERGIPILQLLGKELGKTPAQVAKLASQGKIDFKTFQNAMEKGLGGAALKSGKTFTGSLNNLTAALGRLGAAALSGIFPELTKGMGDATKQIDKLEPKAKALGKEIGEFAHGAGPIAADAFETIGDAVKLAAPPVEALVKGFAALPDSSRKIILLAGAALLLKNRFGEALPSIQNFDKAAALATTKAVGVKTGAIAAAAGLSALASSAGGANTALGALSTVGSGIAAGFAVGGPWGAAIGGGAGLLSVFTSRSSSAAAAQAQLDQIGKTVAATLDQQTGALTKLTRATAAKQLADSGAFNAAQAMGISLSDVTDAALGNTQALYRVSAASEFWADEQARSGKYTEKQEGQLQTLRKAIGATSSSLADQRKKIQQVNEAMSKGKDKTVTYRVRTPGLGSAIGGIAALGDSINALIRKSKSVPNIGKNAKGTDYWRGGLTVVGEEGPELINLKRGAQVIPNHMIRDVSPVAAGSSGGSMSGRIVITNWREGTGYFEQVADGRVADAADLAATTGRQHR